MNRTIAAGYRSRSQIARVVTEDWALHNLYCAGCDSDTLRPFPANMRAVDYQCPKCTCSFQLKSGARWSERRIPDAGYEAMMRAIESDSVPNLLVMQYASDWSVRNLILVPSFFFAPSSIQRRRPLSSSARRAGWVGCNIVLTAIAPEGKLPMVADGVALSRAIVREHYARVRPLANLSVNVRGWTLDVLRVVRGLNQVSFSLEDVYVHESSLRALYPRNRNVRPKIRQQLQVLRDLGLVRFVGRGRYELVPGPTPGHG